ncbi:MAG: phosphatase PAP2 family protein [Lachnospirales bacterium]
MNRKLFFSIYNFTINHKWAKNLGIFVSKYSQKLFILIYIIGIFLVYKYNFNGIFKFILIPFITLLYNSFLRHILGRKRPFVKEGITPLIPHEQSGSCPSNHGASAMIIAISYSCINVYVSIVLVIFAIFTGISRVMTGLHYPFDILLSWIIAIIIGTIGFLI